jgi:hypothetical protein
MIYTNWKQIIENIEIGSEIAYYFDGNLEESELSKGIVTKIIRCEHINCGAELKGRFKRDGKIVQDRWRCGKKIGIDGKTPDCMVYGGKLIIKYINTQGLFIKDDEFKV